MISLHLAWFCGMRKPRTWTGTVKDMLKVQWATPFHMKPTSIEDDFDTIEACNDQVVDAQDCRNMPGSFTTATQSSPDCKVQRIRKKIASKPKANANRNTTPSVDFDETSELLYKHMPGGFPSENVICREVPSPDSRNISTSSLAAAKSLLIKGFGILNTYIIKPIIACVKSVAKYTLTTLRGEELWNRAEKFLYGTIHFSVKCFLQLPLLIIFGTFEMLWACGSLVYSCFTKSPNTTENESYLVENTKSTLMSKTWAIFRDAGCALPRTIYTGLKSDGFWNGLAGLLCWLIWPSFLCVKWTTWIVLGVGDYLVPLTFCEEDTRMPGGFPGDE